MADPIDTGKKTPEGRIIWNDGGKDYSERTTTFEIGGKYYTMPTVSEDGLQYTSDQVRDYVAEYGPIDFLTGEKLPEFRNRDDALEYAVSRSDTRKSFDKGGLAEQTDTLFGYTAEGAEQEGKRLATDVNTDLTFKDAATFVAEATPIIGDAIAAKEVYDELRKENPNYLLVGALGGAALIGLIPGLGDAAAAGIRKGAKSALDTSKRMIPTKKVDDAYNPVIDGDSSYDPIVEKYLNQEPEKLLALALKKNPSETDEQLIKDINKKIADKDIAELQAQKDSGLFNNEADLVMAHGKGVLSTPEYFRAKSDFITKELNSLNPSDPKFKEYEKFSDVYSNIDLATLLDFAREYPSDPNVVGKEYLKFADDVRKYDNKLVEFADDIGVDPNDFIDVVKDAIPFTGDSVFPNYLPRAEETGDLYPRKAADYTQSLQESLLAKIPTKKDRAASKLGFDDTVYHLAVSEDEFTKFKNVDDLIPEVRDGPTNKFQGTPHDLLGVHVGTARAAAERFRAKSVDLTESPRYTMQLRAKLDKPVRVEDISEMIGFNPLELELDDSGLNFTEKDLKTIIYNKAMQKNTQGKKITTTMENQAAIELRKELADSGFTHIPYVNELEDKESISYIMLVDRKKDDPAVLRDYNAKFDPEEAASTDLRMSQGGVAMKDQMEMAFMQEGGLKDDGMDVDPVSGNDVPPGSMASEVRDDIPAQLSEGEYVVPADVVQYYGVKFFEELRMDAKRGLADMESNGRIGGEPVDMPMDMPMDDTPTVAVSTGGYIDGMPAAEYNVGGMTGSLYNNPTQMDQEVNNIISTMYNNPQVMDELSRRGIQLNRTQAPMNPQQMDQANPPAEARMGFNPGGLTDNQAAAYDYITSPTIPGPMYQTPGASYTFASPPQLTTTSAGTGSNMPSVEYCNSIDMDYDPSTKMCVPRASAQTPQQGGGNDDPGPDMPKPQPWFENVNWEDPTTQMDSFFGKEGRIGSAVAGVAGSMIGGPLVGGALTFGAQVSNLAQARAMANVYESMGMSKEAQDIRDKVDGITEQNKALGMADETINKFVGSDGDMLTISAMRDAGVDVPRGLRDDELKDYLKDLSDESRRLLRKRYAPDSKQPITPTKDEEKPGDDTFLGGTKTGTTDSGTPIYKPGPTTTKPKPRPKPKPKPNTKVALDNQSAADDAMGRPTAASQRQKDADKFTASKIADYKKTGRATGFNKGGLMKKKKK